jgi:hypothetical protein
MGHFTGITLLGWTTGGACERSYHRRPLFELCCIGRSLSETLESAHRKCHVKYRLTGPRITAV